MPSIRKLARLGSSVASRKQKINWHPGHMYSGMKAMIGKLSTVDCIIEVHDARIPLIGRNIEFKDSLCRIKPHILVLNKMDLADLSRWDIVKRKLQDNGDENVLLTNLTGSDQSLGERGYDRLLDSVVKLINESDRNNREGVRSFKVMFVGIPNVGKSTLINRLRQHHIGLAGEPATTGPSAGVTKNVPTMIKICSRPLVYSLDTPGVLKPGTTSSHQRAMKLALCAAINDDRLDFRELAKFLLDYLNETDPELYVFRLELSRPAQDIDELVRHCANQWNKFVLATDTKTGKTIKLPDEVGICRAFVKQFRSGLYGKVLFT